MDIEKLLEKLLKKKLTAVNEKINSERDVEIICDRFFEQATLFGAQIENLLEYSDEGKIQLSSSSIGVKITLIAEGEEKRKIEIVFDEKSAEKADICRTNIILDKMLQKIEKGSKQPKKYRITDTCVSGALKCSKCLEKPAAYDTNCEGKMYLFCMHCFSKMFGTLNVMEGDILLEKGE